MVKTDALNEGEYVIHWFTGLKKKKNMSQNLSENVSPPFLESHTPTLIDVVTCD